MPYYPGRQVAGGYSGSRYRRQDWYWDRGASATVWRYPLWVPAAPGGGRRMAHLASFAATSAPALLAQARWRPDVDVVLMLEPTLFCAPAALLTARLAGARAWLHIQDLEVDAAFDMGLMPAGRLRRFALAAERALLARLDRVTTISERMLDRLRRKGLPATQTGLFPNWADVRRLHPLPTGASPFRAELDLSPGQVVALYAGNLGDKQGPDLLIDAAMELQDSPDIQDCRCPNSGARACRYPPPRSIGNTGVWRYL